MLEDVPDTAVGPSGGSADGDVLRRFLARAYELLGARIVVAFLLGGIGFGTLTGVLTAVWLARYLRFSAEDLLVLVAVGLGVVAIVGLGFLWFLRGLIGTVLSWSGDGRTAENAASVWLAAVALPRAVAVRGGCGVAIGVPLTVVPFAVVSGKSAITGLVLAITAAATDTAVLILLVISTDLALRPFLADVAAFLPADFALVGRGWRLRTKALAPLPLITLYSALTVGAFADLVGRGPGRLAVALGIGIVTIMVASAIFWATTRTLLDPIDGLLSATDRVSAGDVTTPVPVVTSDELGGLAVGFNRMLASLRRHEDDAAAAEDERHRLERDIHDGAQQRLAAIGMWLDGLENHLATGAHAAAAELARRASDELREAIDDLRRLSRGLPPPILASQGLDPALQELIARTPAATIRGTVGAEVAPKIRVAAYYAVAEALTNALRHSGASQIAVDVGGDDAHLWIEIRDNGSGGASLDSGSGLRGLAGRLGACNGRLELSSPPGSGTVLQIRLPRNYDRGSPSR